MKSAHAPAVKYGLEKLNEEVAAWMMGFIMEDGTKSRPPFLAMGSSQSVMWNRDFGQERFQNLQQRWKACMDVEGMLKLLGARQLIIGHTPQVPLHGPRIKPCISSAHTGVEISVIHYSICFLSTLSCDEAVCTPKPQKHLAYDVRHMSMQVMRARQLCLSCRQQTVLTQRAGG